MKKFYFALALAATGTALSAQQLPNVGFSEWKEACDSTMAYGGDMGYTGMRQRPGVEPAGWNGSNVNQHVLLDVAVDSHVTKGEGLDGEAVKLTNTFVGVWGIGSVAPGYINLGTPWVYADIAIDDCDGGSYGGIDFAYKPDALQLDVMRNDDVDEISSVVAYAWKGEFKSMVGTISAPAWEQTDVDRAIMGRTATIEGSNGELVAAIDTTLTTTNGEWVTLTYDFDYKSDATPEKLNVIVCSGDYWTRTNLKENTSLTVDNIKLIYHSTLASLTFDGVEAEGFAPDVYDYTFSTAMPANIEYTLAGRNATADVIRDEAAGTAMIIVSNVGEDADGLAAHIYNLKFQAGAAEDGESVDYSGKLVINMLGEALTPDGGQDATLNILFASDMASCTVTMPNFALDLGDGPVPLGDIVVANVEVFDYGMDGMYDFTGSVEGLELLDGALVADVNIQGVEISGLLDMRINVIWEGIPIECHFMGTRQTSAITEVETDDAPVEIYDLQGVRVNGDQLPAGIYIRRQGNKVSKILVK